MLHFQASGFSKGFWGTLLTGGSPDQKALITSPRERVIAALYLAPRTVMGRR